MMKRLHVRLAQVGALIALCQMSGCSSGSGGSGGGGGGGGGGGSADTRAVLLDSITAKCGTFTGDDMTSENQQMLAFLKTKPEFVQTGLTPSGAWGRFADGTNLFICNNINPAIEPDQPDLTRSIQLLRQSQTIRNSTSTRQAMPTRDGIPIDGTVMLGTSLGSFFEGFSNRIPNMFKTENYTRVQPDSSLDALSKINDVSVLYMFGHGGSFPIFDGGDPVFNVWSSTLRARDGSTDTPYLADLHSGAVSYFVAQAYPTDPKIKGPKKNYFETHYCFSSKFVTKYWTGKLDKDSLVFMNTCDSASPAALDFELACLNAGASYYLGWSDRMMIGEGLASAAFLFDRMLGSNSTELGASLKATPPQRAFSILEVLNDMSTHNRSGAAYALDKSGPAPVKKGDAVTIATLQPMSLNQKFEQLAPSIHDLAINEGADELSINGFFGDEKGSVSIGSTDMVIKEWTPISITCKLDRTGTDSSGPVKVYNHGGHVSNIVPLTAWHGTGTYTVEEAGSLKMVMTFDMRFRGDYHGPRTGPGVTPDDPAMSFNLPLSTTGTYAFSGTYTSPPGTFTESWSGSGSLAARQPGSNTSADNTISYFGTIVNNKWDTSLLAYATKGNHVHTISRKPDLTIINERSFDEDGFGISNFDGIGGNFQATVHGDSLIDGGTRTQLRTSNFDNTKMATYTLTWTPFTPDNAAGPMTTRGAAVRRGSSLR